MRSNTASVGLALCTAVLVAAACDNAGHPLEPGAAEAHHSAAHMGALFERAWHGDIHWGLVKPRPPGIGANDGVRVPLYQIAAVDPADPLSPPIEIPGVMALGGRDHVVRIPAGNRGEFTGVGQTVVVLLPGWSPAPPFTTSCDAPDLGPLADRIAWAWLDPVPHPCGRAPQVYAAQLDGDACVRPLTSVERIDAAAAQGLIALMAPPEEPWPFALRPLTGPGQGRTAVSAPACVAPGERAAVAD
jgi:hypothetical protein